MGDLSGYGNDHNKNIFKNNNDPNGNMSGSSNGQLHSGLAVNLKLQHWPLIKIDHIVYKPAR